MQYITPELDCLARWGVIEFDDGWHNSPYPDPFARLDDTLEGWDLVGAFGTLALSYSQTVERRLAKTIARFVADDRHDDDMRRLAYVYFLDVIGVPVSKWPKRLPELHIPAELDWRKLNAFLPRTLRQRHGSANLN